MLYYLQCLWTKIKPYQSFIYGSVAGCGTLPSKKTLDHSKKRKSTVNK
jgi:hypothetical protein